MQRSRGSGTVSGQAAIHPGIAHLRPTMLRAALKNGSHPTLLQSTRIAHRLEVSCWLCRELVQTPPLTLRISIRHGAFNSSYVVRGGKHRAMLPLTELDHGREAPSLFGTDGDNPVSPR
jgi:hypothetical protein